MSKWHKQNRLVKRHILSKSKDPKVRAIHESVSSEQRRRAAQKTNEWKEREELRSLVQNVTFEKMRGAVKKDGVGLG